MMGLMVPGTGWAEKNPYVANAVHFDGAATYLTRGGGLTGAVDSKLLTGSFWFKSNIDGTTKQIVTNSATLSGGTSYFNFRSPADNRMTLVGFNSSNSLILTLHSSANSNKVSNGWVHYVVSVDMANTSKRHVYINDVSDLAIAGPYTDDVLDLTRPDWSVGARCAGQDKVDGDLADVMLWPGVYVDLSVASNRRLFIDAGGKPVDPDVSIAILGTPAIALRNPTSTWHSNQGSGGGFSEHGTLADATTSPSD